MPTKTVAKWVIIGDGFVGKMCFIIKATTNAFPGDYVATVVSSYRHDIQLRDRGQFAIILWDIGN